MAIANPEKEVTVAEGEVGNGKKGGKRPAEVTFPRDSLIKALKVAKAIEDSNAGRPFELLGLAKAIGISPGSSTIRQLLASSNRYGLTDGSYKSDKISLTALGVSIVSPKEEGEDAQGRLTALMNPPVFRKILEYYNTKKIPSEEIFKNALRREFGIPPEDVESCYAIIMANIRDFHLLENIKGSDYIQIKKVPLRVVDEEPVDVEEEKNEEEAETGSEDAPEAKEAPLPPQVKQIFVAHGKNKKPLEQLKAILSQFKVPFVVAIDEPHKGRPISDKVAQLMRECSSGIFIFTTDEDTTDSEGKRVLRPSDNVVYELGAGMILYSDKIVILREEGVTFGSDFTSYGHITFEKDKLDAKAFDLMRELIGLGFLKITPT